MAGSHYPTAMFSGDRAVMLRFPYHAGLVEAIKRSIPVAYRDYIPGTKTWRIGSPFDDSWAFFAVDLLRDFYPYARVVNDPRDASSAHTRPDDFAVLHLLPTAPPQLVVAAFRVLSLRLHPDRGGDHNQMVLLNTAFERLKDRGAA